MGLFFTPEGAPSDATIYLAAEETPLDAIFELRVEAEGAEDLFGLAFQVRFPGDLLAFRPNQVEEGDLLSEEGDVETELQVARSGDLLTVGLTRLGQQPGAEGSGRLLTLRFALRDEAEGTGELGFERNDTRDSQGRIQQNVEWLGGSIEVLR
jgi:hypothetical protein